MKFREMEVTKMLFHLGILLVSTLCAVNSASSLLKGDDSEDAVTEASNLRATGYMYHQYGDQPPRVIYLNDKNDLKIPPRVLPLPKTTTPEPESPEDDTKEFVDLANEYFKKQKLHTKVSDSANKKRRNNPSNGAPTGLSAYKTYDFDRPQVENGFPMKNINKNAPPYGYVMQIPRPKGLSANYQLLKVIPIKILRNPFAVYHPIFKALHFSPGNKPPPKPPIYVKPTVHTPVHKGTHKKSSEEHEEEHEEEETHEESENSEESGDDHGSEETVKKVHKKYGKGDETSEENKQKGHKSKKHHKEGGHNSHEEGFVKTDGVKYNHEDRSRKGFQTDKGYNKFDSFGKGKKGEYDEKHHSEREAAKKAHEAAAHDAAKKHGEHHEQESAENGGKFNELKSHNKGSKTTGYHNVFHKDEYKKVHTFYDDADHRGAYKKFGKTHQQHDSNKGDNIDKGYHRSKEDVADHSKNTHFRKGSHDVEDKGYRNHHGNEFENSNEETYSAHDHSDEHNYRHSSS